MALLFDLLDQSKQCNRTSLKSFDQLPYHSPNHKYKITHHALIIPNLPAPFHYLNFYSLMGQLNAPAFSHHLNLENNALDTATVMTSVSGQMLGHLNTYSIKNECSFQQNNFQFLDKERLSGTFPNFYIERNDSELSYKIKITVTDTLTQFIKLRMSLADYWSLLCHCEGEIIYKDQKTYIQQLGAFQFARTIQFPQIPFAFYTYQLLNLKNNKQIICMQIRNELNHVIQSRLYLRDSSTKRTEMVDDNVEFKIHRVYPQIKTQNGQQMYLPREFEWNCSLKDGTQISISAQSRGDFKFGLGMGYVGSFNYCVKLNNEEEIAEGGYCEYIDCRLLKWQEQNKEEKNAEINKEIVPFMIKR